MSVWEVRERRIIYLDPAALDELEAPTPWDTASAIFFLAALLNGAALVLGLAALATTTGG